MSRYDVNHAKRSIVPVSPVLYNGEYAITLCNTNGIVPGKYILSINLDSMVGVSNYILARLSYSQHLFRRQLMSVDFELRLFEFAVDSTVVSEQFLWNRFAFTFAAKICHL